MQDASQPQNLKLLITINIQVLSSYLYPSTSRFSQGTSTHQHPGLHKVLVPSNIQVFSRYFYPLTARSTQGICTHQHPGRFKVLVPINIQVFSRYVCPLISRPSILSPFGHFMPFQYAFFSCFKVSSVPFKVLNSTHICLLHIYSVSASPSTSGSGFPQKMHLFNSARFWLLQKIRVFIRGMLFLINCARY